MALETRTEIYELFEIINEKHYKKLVDNIGIPRNTVAIHKVNLDWNIIYKKTGKDAFPIATTTFKEIPESGILTHKDVFLSVQHVSKGLLDFIESVKDKIPNEALYLDFFHSEPNGHSIYQGNLVYLYNPCGSMILQDKEKNEYYFRPVNTSIDDKRLTERGLYKLGKSSPSCLIPDGLLE